MAYIHHNKIIGEFFHQNFVFFTIKKLFSFLLQLATRLLDAALDSNQWEVGDEHVMH